MRLQACAALLAACAPAPLPTDGWLDPQPPGPPCAGEAAPPLEGSLALRVLVGPDVPLDAARRQTGRLAAVWGGYGLQLRLAAPPARVPERALLVGEAAGLAAIDVADPAERDRAVANVILAPARELLRREATPPRDEVVVVLLDHLLAPGSAASAFFTELRGLTLRHDTGAWGPLLDLAPFTPTIAVAVAEDDAPPPGHIGLTAAHELGHALGLPHVGRDGDLMREGWARCVPPLTQAARDTLTLRSP